MSGADILADIQAAVREVHAEVGDGTEPKCVIIRPGEDDDSTYPPTPGAPIRYEAQAWESKYSVRDRENTNISARDLKIMAVPPFVNVADASDTTEPRNGDALEWKGRRYSVENTPRTAPSTSDFLYEIQARAGE